jgi:hypothetical protein
MTGTLPFTFVPASTLLPLDDPPLLLLLLLLLLPPSVPIGEDVVDVPPPHAGTDSTPQTNAHVQPARDRHRIRPTSPSLNLAAT